MFDSILTPLDGSPLAESVLPAVGQLARKLHIPVILLSAIPTSTTRTYGPTPGEAVESLIAAEEARARDYLARKQETMATQGVTVRTEVRVVSGVAEAIADYARAEGIGLIAMSTHGRTGVQRWVMGSVADRVLHIAITPVLLLRPREEVGPRPFEHVLVPLDMSPLAEQALPYAETLARRLELPLTLVYVQTPFAYYSIDPVSGGYLPAAADIELKAEHEAAAYLDGQASALRERGIRLEASLRHGYPAQQIIQTARENPGSVIVMSTHGRSGLSRAILGSVAGTVVRESGLPVLLVRAQEPPAATATAPETAASS